MSSPNLGSGPITLADLPNELVFIILEELDLEETISVACLCRRLNYVALSYYIHRAMEPNRTATTSLWCSLSHTHGELSTLLFGALDAGYRLSFSLLKAIRLWLVMSPPIKDVTCMFSNDFAQEAEQVTRYFGTCPELDVLTLTFFSIHLGYSVEETEKQRNRATLEKLLRSLGRVVAGPLSRSLTLMGDLVIEEGGSAFDGPPLKNFETVHLSDSNFLFCPSFSDWTITSLNACCITSLRLNEVDIGPSLHQIQMDSLERLMILSCPRLLHSDLIPFLSRHAYITQLEAFLLGPAGNTAFTSGSLPNLTRVVGPMDFLLVGLALPSVMASVADVAVSDSSISPSIDDTQRLLSFVADRPSITSLSIPLDQLNSTRDWLDYIGTRYEPQVAHLTRLRVNALGFHFDEETTRRMVDAVSLFPQVDEFSMWAIMMGTEWEEEFLAKARETCHGLKAVGFSPTTKILLR
ncbi:hypothetical protein ARMSODRAFT_951323 [Armillaria solidipes]|uniref:F-box domain-containing protein n=1 Tax=Armillaria solidipes TaxID=1076256 RepID=A0A2H3CGG2_9AGAR|nr:hypothetical protein ARMSODRAFT_951323 [Armillaria solidipes]